MHRCHLSKVTLKAVMKMKQTELKIKFSEEKLFALEQYMATKDEALSVESQLEESMEKLYEKYVPAQVRDFIEIKNGVVQPKKKKAAAPKNNSQSKADTAELLTSSPTETVPNNNLDHRS